MVPKVGLEPTRYRYQRILSPSRLPIPSLRLIWYIVARRLRKSKQKAEDGALFLRILRMVLTLADYSAAPAAGCCAVSGSIGVTYMSSIRCSAISFTAMWRPNASISNCVPSSGTEP